MSKVTVAGGGGGGGGGVSALKDLSKLEWKWGYWVDYYGAPTITLTDKHCSAIFLPSAYESRPGLFLYEDMTMTELSSKSMIRFEMKEDGNGGVTVKFMYQTPYQQGACGWAYAIL